MEDDHSIVRELQIKEALRDLINSYSRAADRGDCDLLESLFHPKAIIDSGVIRATPKVFAARFGDWLRQNADRIFHMACTARFEIDGAQARGDVQVIALCQMNHLHDNKRLITAGRYADTYVQYGGKWVFGERVFTPEMTWECP